MAIETGGAGDFKQCSYLNLTSSLPIFQFKFNVCHQISLKQTRISRSGASTDLARGAGPVAQWYRS